MTDLTLHDFADAFDGHRRIAAAPNQFEAGSYRGERISKLVREHRQELIFPSVSLPHLILGASALDSLPGALGGIPDEFDLV